MARHFTPLEHVPRILEESAGGVLKTNDVCAAQGEAANALAAAMPSNDNKKFEYGHGNALSPRPGPTAEPLTPALTASTGSVLNKSSPVSYTQRPVVLFSFATFPDRSKGKKKKSP